MKIKQLYETPELEIVSLQQQVGIATSSTPWVDPDPDESIELPGVDL